MREEYMVRAAVEFDCLWAEMGGQGEGGDGAGVEGGEQ